MTAYFGCIETQACGALHFHVILWGGITPKLLEKAANGEYTRKEAALDAGTYKLVGVLDGITVLLEERGVFERMKR